MASWENQSYARDFADDPRTLAEARLYISPCAEQDDILQHMMGAALSGRAFQTALPHSEIGPATERLLSGVMRAEIGLARTVLAQWDLFGDIPALTRELAAPLTKPHRRLFSRAVNAIVVKYGEANADMFLRRTNGEPKDLIAADYQLKYEVVKGRIYQCRKLLDDTNGRAVLDLPFEPTFPRPRRQSTVALLHHISDINDGAVELGRRISLSDLETIGHLLCSHGFAAGEINQVLQYLTVFPGKGARMSPAARRGHNFMRHRLPKCAYDTLASFSIRRVARRRQPRQEIYENSDEATKLIYDALVSPRQGTLSKEEQRDAAKDIEAGVYAEKKQQELLADRSPDELSVEEKQLMADLHTIATTGQTAILTLLNTHTPLVRSEAWKLRRRNVLYEDMVLTGMRAVLRAIRKYDYLHPSDKRFTNYAIPWVRQYMWRHVFKHAWKVGPDVGVNMIRIFSAQTRLKIERAVAGDQKEVSSADIAEHLDLPLAEVERLLHLHQNATSDAAPRFSEDRKHKAFDVQPMASARMQFAPRVREAFSRVLTEPHVLQVLELHIGADAGIKEIAQITSLTEAEIPKIITAALSELSARFGRRELSALLQSQSDGNVYEEILGV